jgi:hypothetical protein
LPLGLDIVFLYIRRKGKEYKEGRKGRKVNLKKKERCKSLKEQYFNTNMFLLSV